MTSGCGDGSSVKAFLLPDRRAWRIVVLVVIFAAALAARLYRIDNPILRFRPTRQYRSALIARAYYYRGLDSIPEWQRQVAESNLRAEPLLEAPIMEWLAVAGYHLAGGEHLWIPRSFSALFWVIGGLFVYRIAGRIASEDAALLGTLFYLFLPYGVTASRSFQRDPLMIMLMLASLLAVVRDADRRSAGGLIVAAVLSAAAIFVKPIVFFPIFGAYIALGVARAGLLKAVLNARFVLFAVIALAPTLVYTAYGLFVSGFLTEQAERSFFPQVMIYPYFWHGWLTMIGESTGRAAFVAGLLGIIAFRHAFSRALAIGLWAGYFVFGLVFNYGTYTHNYYHLMLIPIIALSVTPLADMLLDALRRLLQTRWLRRGARAALVLLVFLPVEPQLWERADPRLREGVAEQEEIGALVNHSTETILLDAGYGNPLRYHGSVGGVAWPDTSYLRLFELQGLPPMSAEARLDDMLQKHPAAFFIITAMGEYRAQKDLVSLLTTRYRVLRETDDYIIFDMRERIDAEEHASGPSE